MPDRLLCFDTNIVIKYMTPDEAEELWTAFLSLPIDFIDSPALRSRAFAIAARWDLPTLYDAAFLACTEVAHAPSGIDREFWTADHLLLHKLSPEMPAYVRDLRS